VEECLLVWIKKLRSRKLDCLIVGWGIWKIYMSSTRRLWTWELTLSLYEIDWWHRNYRKWRTQLIKQIWCAKSVSSWPDNWITKWISHWYHFPRCSSLGTECVQKYSCAECLGTRPKLSNPWMVMCRVHYQRLSTDLIQPGATSLRMEPSTILVSVYTKRPKLESVNNPFLWFYKQLKSHSLPCWRRSVATWS
jgi:hypothetical protein